mgnify:FL=1|jgi:hypothetical protein
MSKNKFIEVYSNNETINNKYGYIEAYSITSKKKNFNNNYKVFKNSKINLKNYNLNFYIIYSILLLLIIFQLIIFKK